MKWTLKKAADEASERLGEEKTRPTGIVLNFLCRFFSSFLSLSHGWHCESQQQDAVIVIVVVVVS